MVACHDGILRLFPHMSVTGLPQGDGPLGSPPNTTGVAQLGEEEVCLFFPTQKRGLHDSSAVIIGQAKMPLALFICPASSHHKIKSELGGR